jgi:hypothetical protein
MSVQQVIQGVIPVGKGTCASGNRTVLYLLAGAMIKGTASRSSDLKLSPFSFNMASHELLPHNNSADGEMT